MSDQKTIADIIADIERRSADGDYIFRGETQSSYKDRKGNGRTTEVSSKLWRDYGFREEERGFIEQVQREMLDGAKEHMGRPSQSFDTEDPNDFEILTQIQHYGGKTNLIDFTTDYRIALFFACDGHYAKEGRVILQKKDSIDGKIETPWTPQHRVIAQKSVFVIPPNGFIEPTKEEIVVIPADLKAPTLNYLKKYHGITKEMIYNDLHGFVSFQEVHGGYYTMFYKGIADMNQRNYDGAIKNYSAAIGLNPVMLLTYYYRGNAYSRRGNEGDFDKAIIDYNEVLKSDPENQYLYYGRMMAWICLEEWEKAKADFPRANALVLFYNEYKSVANFEQETGIKLPDDIVAMLTDADSEA